jgi:hypothetical protein
MPEIRLECGHLVEMTVGTRVWCYYDMTFGVVERDTADGNANPWWDFTIDGSPYKAAGSRGYYNAERLACVPCGLVNLRRRRNDPLVRVGESWELRPAGELA